MKTPDPYSDSRPLTALSHQFGLPGPSTVAKLLQQKSEKQMSFQSDKIYFHPDSDELPGKSVKKFRLLTHLPDKNAAVESNEVNLVSAITS